MFGLATKKDVEALATRLDELMENHFPTLNRRIDSITHWVMATLVALILAILGIVVTIGATAYMLLR